MQTQCTWTCGGFQRCKTGGENVWSQVWGCGVGNKVAVCGVRTCRQEASVWGRRMGCGCVVCTSKPIYCDCGCCSVFADLVAFRCRSCRRKKCQFAESHTNCCCLILPDKVRFVHVHIPHTMPMHLLLHHFLSFILSLPTWLL